MLSLPLFALAWLGRQGARAVAALVFIGIAVPPLGALLRPYVGLAVFALLTISLTRVDTAALRQHLRRPWLIVAATAWTALGVPLLVYAVAAGLGVRESSPGLFLGLMLQGMTSPMMATPAIAALMGLDATLVLITLVTATAVVPFVAPLFAFVFLRGTLSISPSALGLKLAVVLLGAALLAGLVRRVAGREAIEKYRDGINGLNILVLLVFVTAVMGDVARTVVSDPLEFLGMAVVAFGVFIALMVVTAWVFHRCGRRHAWSLAVMASQRNMGLMVTATEGVLPGATWLYFALCQFPVYLSPLLLRRVLQGAAEAR